MKLTVTSSHVTKVRLSAEADGRPAFTATLELQPVRGNPHVVADEEFAPELPDVLEYPPAVTQAAVSLGANAELLARLFPSLSAPAHRAWIADLLATTRVVGMRCPGMDSIYSGLRLHRATRTESPGQLRYEVTGTEPRLRLVRMQVNGAHFEGTIEAFFRPRPVAQCSLREVAARVRPGVFAGDRALVVGGSRGLGEVTAKIVAAAGAEVSITYARGQQDAERVCAEIREHGQRCEVHQLDISRPVEQECGWLKQANFSHVYYFASPPIPKSAGPWNEALFEQFRSIYVTAFGRLVELVSAARTPSAPIRVLYPSSIFVERPENGFAEYSAAKAEGEALCDRLAQQLNVTFAKPRLPRLKTDQTSALLEMGTQDALPVLLTVIEAFHSRGELAPADRLKIPAVR